MMIAAVYLKVGSLVDVVFCTLQMFLLTYLLTRYYDDNVKVMTITMMAVVV